MLKKRKRGRKKERKKEGKKERKKERKKKENKSGLKFYRGLELTGLRTTKPRAL